MEDEDEVDVLGDFCLNLETDLNHYDATEFPAQNSELLGDYMQHPWLLDSSQVWYFDQNNDDKSKNTIDNMIHEEKKHFLSGSSSGTIQGSTVNTSSIPKVSPVWTKDDKESLRRGIELHRHNWSKVARFIGTKTTLQVKSYIKSHPELIASLPTTDINRSTTPSPPQFINEVEIGNNESAQFSADELVNEAEIPATMEEVIASVSSNSNSWNWSKSQKWKKSNLTSNKPHANKSPKRTIKNLPFKKKTQGRPKKLTKESPSKNPPSLSNRNVVPPVKKIVPLLEGEIIRLQKGELNDSKSDSEIDIDGDDHSCGSPQREIISEPVLEQSEQEPIIEIAPQEVVSNQEIPHEKEDDKICIQSVDPAECVDVLPELVPEPKSECESSETDTKQPINKCPPDATEPQQPVFTFPVPAAERIVDVSCISDEEKTIHWDFFEGRPSKTPERYMKIRNSIVQEWRRVKPRYLTKTSVRPTLKNCGDVNCISRIHAYLELTGAINFGCDQVQYDRSLPPVPCHRERIANSTSAAIISQQNSLQSLLVRARKKRQLLSESCDENGGYTISHDGTAQTRLLPVQGGSQQRTKPLKKSKPLSEDPFQLVQCISFGGDKPAPFEVKLSMQALTVIDVHSHLCTTEVIGLLGGHFSAKENENAAVLYVEAAQPCRSQATNHQCEMCPVSQTEGCEELRSRGLDVVGWYHSHPTFPANPSLRDLRTQSEFQQWFSRQDAPFIGLIVNPFSTSGIKSSLSLKSTIRCITVHDEQPYKHDMAIESESNSLQEVNSTLRTLETNLATCPTLVPLDSAYPYVTPSRPEDEKTNYAKKVIYSLRAHLEPIVSPPTMTAIEQLTEEFLNRMVLHHPPNVSVEIVSTDQEQ